MATTSSPDRWRLRSVAVAGAATAAVLTIFGGASSIGASGETSSTDDSTTTTVAATTTAATAEASAPAPSEPQTASSEEFAAALVATCEGDAGHPLLASALRNAALPDGSLRVVSVLQACDVEFVGAVDAELGRPLTNVEELIADPVNNVTPNQAQRDVLNAELAVYWRLAEAWTQTQAGAEAPPEDTEASADTAPASADEPATTGG